MCWLGVCTCACVCFQLDTNTYHLRRGNLSRENTTIGLDWTVSKSAGHFLDWVMWESALWVVPLLGRWSGCFKQAGWESHGEHASIAPSMVSASRFLHEFLHRLRWWLTITFEVKYHPHPTALVVMVFITVLECKLRLAVVDESETSVCVNSQLSCVS